MGYVQHIATTRNHFNKSKNLDTDAVYFIEDTQQIYKGPTLYAESAADDIIYFKLSCAEWTSPRIYFFNNHPSGVADPPDAIYDTAYSWDNAPYMLYDETSGYYYYPMLPGYDSVIFYCDCKNSDGFNFKTKICHIPPRSWYKTPLYIQSDIGYDGFWADYATRTTKLLIQHNPHHRYQDPMIDTAVTDATYCINSETISITPKSLGMVVNLGTGAANRSHYEYLEFPIDADNVTYNYTEYDRSTGSSVCIFNRQVSLSLTDIGYIYPVMYLHGTCLSEDATILGTVSGFNAADDSALFSTICNDRDLSLVQKHLEHLERNAVQRATVETVTSQFSAFAHDDTVVRMNVTLHYYCDPMNPEIVHCLLEIPDNIDGYNIPEDLKWNEAIAHSTREIRLPYVSKSAPMNIPVYTDMMYVDLNEHSVYSKAVCSLMINIPGAYEDPYLYIRVLSVPSPDYVCERRGSHIIEFSYVREL